MVKESEHFSAKFTSSSNCGSLTSLVNRSSGMAGKADKRHTSIDSENTELRGGSKRQRQRENYRGRKPA
jgi:hypothetical protein